MCAPEPSKSIFKQQHKFPKSHVRIIPMFADETKSLQNLKQDIEAVGYSFPQQLQL